MKKKHENMELDCKAASSVLLVIDAAYNTSNPGADQRIWKPNIKLFAKQKHEKQKL